MRGQYLGYAVPLVGVGPQPALVPAEHHGGFLRSMWERTTHVAKAHPYLAGGAALVGGYFLFSTLLGKKKGRR